MPFDGCHSMVAIRWLPFDGWQIAMTFRKTTRVNEVAIVETAGVTLMADRTNERPTRRTRRLQKRPKNVCQSPSQRDMGVIWIAPGRTSSSTTKERPKWWWRWWWWSGYALQRVKGQPVDECRSSRPLIESLTILIISDSLHRTRYLPCKSATSDISIKFYSFP